jgi:predicted transcriptional regulator
MLVKSNRQRTLTLKLDDELHDILIQYAKARHTTMSEALRQLILDYAKPNLGVSRHEKAE